MRAASDQFDGVPVEVCARAAAEAVDTMRKKSTAPLIRSRRFVAFAGGDA
jgi:hypothetical protein